MIFAQGFFLTIFTRLVVIVEPQLLFALVFLECGLSAPLTLLLSWPNYRQEIEDYAQSTMAIMLPQRPVVLVRRLSARIISQIVELEPSIALPGAVLPCMDIVVPPPLY